MTGCAEPPLSLSEVQLTWRTYTRDSSDDISNLLDLLEPRCRYGYDYRLEETDYTWCDEHDQAMDGPVCPVGAILRRLKS